MSESVQPFLTKNNSLNELRDIIAEWSKRKGWYEDWHDITKIMLMVCELAEAVEEHREHHAPTEIYFKGENNKPEGIPIELADCIIRILDFCGFHNIDIGMALYQKMIYNETRPYRHGNKSA